MDYRNPHALVNTDWLAANLGAPDLRVVDGTWFFPSTGRSQRKEYEAGHIPGAVFFDIDEIADRESGLPHMLPDERLFAERVGGLGIGNGDRVVVYDANGGQSASHRVWWTFRVFGHAKVAALNGGLPKWRAEGRPTEAGAPSPRPKVFTANFDRALVRDFADVLANVTTGRELVVDARAAGRFKGIDPEPRPAKKRGHVPGSVNLPFTELLDAANGSVLRPADEIAAAAARAGIRFDKPLAASCGSGVTACTIALALFLIGHERVAVYDGSFAEWGNRDEAPVER